SVQLEGMNPIPKTPEREVGRPIVVEANVRIDRIVFFAAVGADYRAVVRPITGGNVVRRQVSNARDILSELRRERRIDMHLPIKLAHIGRPGKVESLARNTTKPVIGPPRSG